MTSETKWTPGPWEYVPSDEHHGPYVCGPFGGDICDCYTMSKPAEKSERNGGASKPIPFFAEMADPNARLIAAAPELYEALEIARRVMEVSVTGISDGMTVHDIRGWIAKTDAALAKARGA